MLNINFNVIFSKEFISDTLAEHRQAVIYGWRACGYERIQELFEKAKPGKIEKIFNCCSLESDHTCEGRAFERIRYDIDKDDAIPAGLCKSRIVEVLLENYKRKKENLNLIPMIFAISRSDWIFKIHIESLTLKVPTEEKLVTFRELRRVYKLMHYPNQQVREIAHETFKFIHLEKVADNTYSLIEVPAPWAKEPEKMAELMARRHLPVKKPPKCADHDWRWQLDSFVAHNFCSAL